MSHTGSLPLSPSLLCGSRTRTGGTSASTNGVSGVQGLRSRESSPSGSLSAASLEALLAQSQAELDREARKTRCRRKGSANTQTIRTHSSHTGARTHTHTHTQLTVITHSLFHIYFQIATKLESQRFPLKAILSVDAKDPEHLAEMQQAVSAREFELIGTRFLSRCVSHVPHMGLFLEEFVKIADLSEVEGDCARCLCHRMLFAHEEVLSCFSPSQIVCAAVSVAKTLFRDNDIDSVEELCERKAKPRFHGVCACLTEHTGYTTEQLLPCIRAVVQVVCRESFVNACIYARRLLIARNERRRANASRTRAQTGGMRNCLNIIGE